MVSKDDVEIAERVTALEIKGENLQATVVEHGKTLDSLDEKFTSLVIEVKSIRKALYAMAAIMAANVPAFSKYVGALTALAGF